MISVGVDIIEIGRVAAALARFGDRFLQRIYTEREIAYCRSRTAELAARFAAKEAISKALGTGLNGISWVEMEVLADRRGKPYVILHGKAEARAQQLGLTQWAISLSHHDSDAIALVMASS